VSSRCARLIQGTALATSGLFGGVSYLRGIELVEEIRYITCSRHADSISCCWPFTQIFKTGKGWSGVLISKDAHNGSPKQVCTLKLIVYYWIQTAGPYPVIWYGELYFTDLQGWANVSGYWSCSSHGQWSQITHCAMFL